MAWVATTSFETTDGSTAPTDGNAIAGTGDGSGWSGNWTNAGGTSSYHQYDDDGSAPDGTWAFMHDTYTAHVNNEPVTYRALTDAVTSGRVSFKVKCNVDNRDNPGIWLHNGTSRALYLLFDQQATGTNRDIIGPSGVCEENCIANNTWYKIDIDFDCTTDTFSVYLNDVSVGTGFSFENASTSVTRFYVVNNSASGFSATLGNTMWIDEIEPYAAPASGPAKLKTWNTIAKAKLKTLDTIAIAKIKTIDTIA